MDLAERRKLTGAIRKLARPNPADSFADRMREVASLAGSAKPASDAPKIAATRQEPDAQLSADLEAPEPADEGGGE